eukprot:NODE_187_length_13529_cov_1.102606.p7 type:complete len:206 gc:universal NODE_187_length_13529_cov_1.102606:5689-6306(+)
MLNLLHFVITISAPLILFTPKLSHTKMFRLILGWLFSLLFLGKVNWDFNELIVFYCLWTIPLMPPTLLLLELYPRTKKVVIFGPLLANIIVLKLLPLFSHIVYVNSHLGFISTSMYIIAPKLNLLEMLYSSSFILFDVYYGYSYYCIFEAQENYHYYISYHGVRISLFTWIFWFILPLMNECLKYIPNLEITLSRPIRAMLSRLY